MRLVVRHILPNALGPIIVGATALVGQSIAIIVTIDFFQYGTENSDTPTLGSLIAHAIPGSGVPWWLGTPPLLVLVLWLVCVNIVGDTATEILNTRDDWEPA